MGVHKLTYFKEDARNSCLTVTAPVTDSEVLTVFVDTELLKAAC